MPLKDQLLDTLNEVTIALEKEIARRKLLYMFEDINLGKRLLCVRCGVHFGLWEEEIHAPVCPTVSLNALIKKSKSYLSNENFS